MKKMFFLGALFAVGLSFTACSSDKDVAEDTGILSKFDNKGEAYLSLQVKTPTTNASTRADEGNDHFQDATDTENAVTSALLFLFIGDGTGGGTTLQGTYKMNVGTLAGGAGTVQSTCTATINNDGVTNSTNLYAFVAVNYDNAFQNLNEGTHQVDLIGGSTITKGTTWTAFQNLAVANIGTIETDGTLGYKGSNMFMSNAPLAVNPNPNNTTATSFSTTVNTLSKVDISKIKKTATEANADPAADVYVERAAVKVTLKCADGTMTGSSTTYKDAAWVLNNTEPTYYTVHNVADSWWPLYSEVYKTNNSGTYYYRFVSLTKADGTNDLYRVYWSVDPHYSSYTSANYNTAETGLTYTNSPTAWLDAKSGDKSNFCTENTMNEWGMTKDKTTCVNIRLTFNNGTGFWTSQNADDILSEDVVKSRIWDYVKLNSSAEYTAFIAQHSNNEATAKADMIWTLSTSAAGPAVWSTSPASTSYPSTTATTNFINKITDAFTTLNFNYYLDGQAYYLLPIRHFGDIETPLAQDGDGDYKKLYGDGTDANANNYLGRYGLVRNNWYNIDITAVRHIGTPTVPNTPPTDPDDDVFSYLAAKVYVLKWAKRSYSVSI